MPMAPPADDGGLLVTRLDAIAPEVIRWLVPGYMAENKLVLIAGDGGHGKSQLTLHIASMVSRGEPCFGLRYPRYAPGETLIMSFEDGYGDTIVPRLLATGADRSKIFRLDGMPGPDGKKKAFNLLEFQRLRFFAKQHPNLRVVIIDPAGAYIGKTGVDDHKDSELRSLLDPLSEVAEEMRLTIILVKHLSKGAGAKAVYRISGGAGYVNAVRAAFIVLPDEEDRATKNFLPIKFNLGPEPSGLIYRIVRPIELEQDAIVCGPECQHFSSEDRLKFREQLVVLDWRGETDISANDLLASANANPNRVTQCMQWIREFLSVFAYPASELMTAAEKANFSRDALVKARMELKAKGGLVNKKIGLSAWWWGFGNPEKWVRRPELSDEPKIIEGTA